MVERLVWLLRRAGDATVAALRVAPEQARDLVLWQLLLAEQAVPGAVLTSTALQQVAFHLTTTGRIEVAIPDGDEWRRALASGVDTELPLPEPTAAEIDSYVEGGFLDVESNRSVLRFASSDIQAALAAEHLAAEPDRITAILPQLAINATARNAVANALRLDDGVGGVHAALLRALARRDGDVGEEGSPARSAASKPTSRWRLAVRPGKRSIGDTNWPPSGSTLRSTWRTETGGRSTYDDPASPARRPDRRWHRQHNATW